MRATIEFQGSLVKAKPHNPWNKKYAPGSPTRGNVTEFSPKSRGRMLEKVARLDEAEKVDFITLTFDDDSIPHNSVELQSHLRAFWEYLRRHHPDSSALWRIELKVRQSGRYKGHIAPHVHMLIWGASFRRPDYPGHKYSGEVCDEFTRIVFRDRPDRLADYDKGYRLRTDYKELKGNRGVMYYVSKYCAKVENPFASQDAILVYLPYSHEGRFWGVFQENKLPFAHLTIVTLEDDSWVYGQFKAECAGEYYPLNFYGDYQGFKLFTEDANDYLLLVRALLDDLWYVPYYRDCDM